MNQLRKKFIFFFFFNDTATTEIYTLSLHDALPISYKTHSSVLSVNHRNKAMMTTKPKTYKVIRSEEHTSELQSQSNLVCRLLLEKKKKKERILRTEESSNPPKNKEQIRLY